MKEGARDTGGLVLSWGNHDAVLELIGQLARREGFGAYLADGVKPLRRGWEGGLGISLSTSRGKTP